jgi:hypothetical protein
MKLKEKDCFEDLSIGSAILLKRMFKKQDWICPALSGTNGVGLLRMNIRVAQNIKKCYKIYK